jgi:accessory colonization factor AcfC
MNMEEVSNIYKSRHAARAAAESLANLTFTDRDSYIAWRTEWRKSVADGSDAVRCAKRARGNSELDVADRNEASCLRQSFRWILFSLYEVRKESKLKAATQYLARTNPPAGQEMPKAA